MKILIRSCDGCHSASRQVALILKKTKIMSGNLTQNEIDQLLFDQSIGRIGCYADGVIYVVPISFAYDGEYIYGHTREGMKVQMMRKNPKICFEVDSLRDMSNWKSVIAWGEFEELKEETPRKSALDILHQRVLPMAPNVTAKLSSEWPFEPMDLNAIKGIVFRLKLTKKTGKFERNSVPSFVAWG